MKTAQGATIQLASGSYFDYEDPWHSEFTIEDIAEGLSKLCRFNGHCRGFYSVAEHSVYVSYLVPKEDARAANMHDSPEAFTGDFPTPLKRLLPDFAKIEKNIEKAVLHRFNIEELPESVKVADRIMLATENYHLLTGDDWPVLTGIKPIQDFHIQCLPPEQAKDFFLARFYELEKEA